MSHTSHSFQEIDLELLHLDPKQNSSHVDSEVADTLLLDSMKRVGLLVPLVVAESDKDGYIVVDGQRRLACARKLGFGKVPCLVHGRMTAGDIAGVRLALHETHKQWTGADFARWRRSVKKALEI